MRTALTTFDQIKTTDEFIARALALFEYQYEENRVYRSYCDLINIAASEVNTLEEIPFLPIQFFKSHTVSCSSTPADQIFTSSKTTGQVASKHHVHDIDLYIKSFEKGFKHFYGNIEDYALLVLLPSYMDQGNSSLIYMANHLIQKTKHSESRFYLEDWSKLRTTLNHLEKRGQKTILLGVKMIGNTVWSNFGDHCLRFGKVVEQKIQNGWAFVRVDWVDDEAFEMDRARVMEMRGYDRYDEWMRIDKVSFFKKQGLINTINKL